MALTFEIDVTVEASPETVFALVADIERFGEWMPNLVSVDVLTEGVEGVGRRFREVRKMFGKEAAEEFEVVGYDPPRRLDLFVDGSKGSSKRGAYHFAHTFEPVDGRAATKMTLAGTIEGMGCVGAVFGFLFKGLFKKAIRKDLNAFKAWAESQ